MMIENQRMEDVLRNSDYSPGCLPPSQGGKRPGPRGRSPGPPPPHWAGRPSLAAQPQPGWSPTLRESAAPDGSRHARHRPRAAFPPPTGGSARLPAFPRAAAGKGREAKRARRSAGAARRARTATARPLSRSPSRARGMGWPGGAARPGGRGVREPVRPGAARLSPRAAAPRPRPPPPAARAAFVTVSSPSEPARRRRCAPGCKWRPLAAAPLTARPARGRLRHRTPGCIPPSPLPGGQIRRHRRPRLRPWRGSRAGPGSPDAPPALRPRRPQPLTAGRGAPAGRAHGLGEDSWSSAGEMPPLEAVPLRPKTSSPNVRETKGICWRGRWTETPEGWGHN